MSTEVENPFDEPDLLSAPVMRAAYSYRTAWLMSAMSELAYYRFEDGNAVLKLATEIAKLSGVKAIETDSNRSSSLVVQTEYNCTLQQVMCA